MKNVRDTASRRRVLKATIGLLAAGGLADTAFASERVAQEKIAQAAVQYQQKPKGDQRCNVCVNWEAPNACKIVAGTISPLGWCVAFAPKSS